MLVRWRRDTCNGRMGVEMRMKQLQPGDPRVLAAPEVEEAGKLWGSVVLTTPRLQTSGLQTHETTYSFWLKPPVCDWLS